MRKSLSTLSYIVPSLKLLSCIQLFGPSKTMNVFINS
ncbi:MAG: hypothetical protein Sylvanvirus17_10 [Sylvanvirus sp.]|uniref:Uncharacterized protein n=1 Tax=Sylvanvirus sp. TaxID=2487774 RepID=A0A3G5AK07_9VIRU|nr:MAG: hypothetical protein Sylvanvirus17_10 [Sylvanvirus sp.]